MLSSGRRRRSADSAASTCVAGRSATDRARLVSPALKSQLRIHARSENYPDRPESIWLIQYCVARGADLGPVGENFGATCDQIDRADVMLTATSRPDTAAPASRDLGDLRAVPTGGEADWIRMAVRRWNVGQCQLTVALGSGYCPSCHQVGLHASGTISSRIRGVHELIVVIRQRGRTLPRAAVL